MPLYHQLEMILKEKIEQGEFLNGDILPGETKLMETYGVSRITVRQALGNLTNAGYVVGKPGIGTVVVFEKIDEHLKSVISFSEEMAQHGISMSTSYCSMEELLPGKAVALQLGIEEDQKCFCLTRVRCAKGVPMVYSHTYINTCWNLPLSSECYSDSLYRFLSERLGILVASATDTLEAVLADEEIARFLQISPGMPVFKRTRKSHDPDQRVIEFSICYYPGDQYKYSVKL